ncbi:hypothetical protein J7F03_24665 [Streptomyces sp. ISL-43]|uniref:hypothetical protein n=1 Tax=Streptomyces sp. ISL-43 TaxID=2819183 RepID=UPI001BEC76CF|nr:hypothetical protein [Streptomyces sp. ISL-43]MBT2450210.1 hypothetical protein [Streptomyces sp. ISL-43]
MSIRNSLRTLAAAGLVLAAVGVGAGTASAAGKDGWLTSGELGLFCQGSQSNSVFDLYSTDEDFQDDYFVGSRSCSGHTTNDWTESFSNQDSKRWSVHTDWYGYGYGTYINAGAKGDLSSTYWNQLSSAYYNR